MKSAQLDGTTYALRLERGDPILETIQDFCAAHEFVNATVSGLGSVENPKLAHYSIDTRQFKDKSLSGIFEIAGLNGNVALVDGHPFAHAHVTLADDQLQVFAGHLISGVCSATLELVITGFETHYEKVYDETIGLKVWDF